LAQGAGGHVHAGGLVLVAVAGQVGARLVQRLQVLIGEEALDGQGGVHPRAGVALGADQLVPVRPLGILRVIAHDSAVENGQGIGQAEAASDVPEAPGLDLLHDADANFQSQLLQLFIEGCIHGKFLLFDIMWGNGIAGFDGLRSGRRLCPGRPGRRLWPRQGRPGGRRPWG